MGIVAKRKKNVLITLAAVAAALLVLVGMTACGVITRMGEQPNEKEKARYAALPNYAEGRFVNREATVVKIRKRSFFRVFRHFSRSVNAPDMPLPQEKIDLEALSGKPDDFAVLWLGHSSLIFELEGVRFMTDPVFGNAAPLPGFVRRYCEAPLKREQIPPLDFMIISHDHYDHLEYETIRALREHKFPFVVSLGVGARLRGWGIAPERIHELNWGDSITLSGLRITARTARHFSGRSASDRNQTLWSSFIIEGKHKKIFFGADGGYGKHFRQIGADSGPFDLVCLEIDAWNDQWPNNHLFPNEVAKAFEDLGGKVLLPIHWGVFDLAGHPWEESVRKVSEEARKAEIPMITPLMGQKVVPGKSPTRA